MRSFACSSLAVFLLLLAGCASTTGEIRDNRFYVAQGFSVDLLNDEWQVTRQTVNPMNAPSFRVNTPWQISFSHKNSNGFIGVTSFMMNELGQARSLDVWADNLVANSGGMKLSQKNVKIDGIDAIELVTSGKYMVKQVFLKKEKKAYRMVYSNSPTYFDQYLGVFDKFVETFRIQE